MLRLPGLQRSRQKKSLFAASSLLLLLSTQGLAQSGRKTVKPLTSPTPIPQNDDVAKPSLNARDLKNKVTLLVGRQNTSKHLLSEDAIFEHLVKRLNELKNVTATSIGEVKHSAAVKRAKSESNALVVLLEFDIDEFQNGTIFLDSPDLDIKVRVFAPITGGEKFKGDVYYKAPNGPNLKKDNGPTGGTPVRITTEAVGIEAAEQVRDWLIIEASKKKP